MNTLEMTLRVNRLLDFYGGLLTAKTRRYVGSYYGWDLSLTEIADEAGVSRQAVLDAVNRAVKQLEAFEDELHLAAHDEARRELLRQLSERLPGDATAQSLIQQLRALDD